MASHAIRKLVVLLGETYRQSVSEATIEAYAVGLEGMAESQVLQAGKRAIQTCKFMPTPAELRDLAGAGNVGRAIVAWGDVQRAMPLGSYKHVDFADPIINAVIRLRGGWPAMFESIKTAEGEKWYRIEFTKAYESLATAGVDGEACRPLAGLGEEQVVAGRVVPAIPVAIGCDATRRTQSLAVVRGAIAAPKSRQVLIPKAELKQA